MTAEGCECSFKGGLIAPKSVASPALCLNERLYSFNVELVTGTEMRQVPIHSAKFLWSVDG